MSDRSHHALPLPDYDHLPLGGLQSRVRSLTAGEVEELLAYEHSHGDRLQVSPATSPQPLGPPPHGTPDQRGRPKGDRTS